MKDKHWVLHSIKSAKDIHILSSVIDRFLDYQYRLQVKFETHDGVRNGIHAFHVNNMRENIERVELLFQSNKKRKNGFKKKTTNNHVTETKKQNKKTTDVSIDKYF